VTFPEGFVWGVAAASHQIEGGNWNNDWWEFEHKPDTPCIEPSGDCTNSFHLYADDVALVREHGFGAYRFSIEWSRIEPEDGEFSVAALDYYRRVLAECHEQGVQPVVTFHHFSNPRWVAADGGWESPQIVDRFTRYCERTVEHLGDLISIGCTINEPNILALMGYVVGVFPPGRPGDLGAYSKVNDNLARAHRRAYDVIKGGRGDFPLGLCVAMGDWWSTEGAKNTLARSRYLHEGQFLEAARGDDFVGVQAYSRVRMDETGIIGPEDGVEVVTSMDYEFWPQALEVAIRSAAEIAQVPIYVTENGLGHEDDGRRLAYVTEALEGVGRCLADGIDVRGYFYWSLLDNFEWNRGYGPQFGLVSVTRDTFVRTPKPSAAWLGGIARANRLA
jgi:beta-glucosidase